MSLLEVTGLAKAFGAVKAVVDVSLNVERGERLAVLGPNGSGKTTVFNLISGVVPPDVGAVSFDGHDITGWSTHRSARAGLVRTFQHASVFPGLDVSTALSTAMEMSPRSRRRERFPSVDAILDVCGLVQLAGTLGRNLSYGNARRTNLAIALAAQPEALLLDEPAAGLNDDETAELAAALLGINQAGTTLVVIDHDMSFIAEICTRAMVLSAGAVLAEGTFAEVAADPQVKTVYLGETVTEEVDT